jgi:hypothetical protein
MNLRFVTGLVAAVALIPMAMGSLTARADDVPSVPPDVSITSTAKSSLNQSTYAEEITQKVTAEVQKLADNAGDAGTVKMVRDWLINENPTNASAPYQQNYSAALNAALMNVLGQGDPAVAFRVNAGIIIWKLSGPKEALAPTAIKLLSDKSPAVVLWGERAAGAIFPLAMHNANGAFNANGGVGSKLIDAIVASLSAHLDGPLAGDIAEQAFNAVNPRRWELNQLAPAAGAMAMLIDANLKMQAARIDYYLKTGVPENPLADTYPSYLIFTPATWSAMNASEQQQAVQNAVNLVSYMGQRVAPQKNMGLTQDLVGALREEGQWIIQLGKILNDGNVQSAGNQIRVLSPQMPAKTITDACDGAFQALSQNQVISGWNPQLTPPQNLSAPTSPAAKSGTDATTGSTPTSLAPQ